MKGRKNLSLLVEEIAQGHEFREVRLISRGGSWLKSENISETPLLSVGEAISGVLGPG